MSTKRLRIFPQPLFLSAAQTRQRRPSLRNAARKRRLKRYSRKHYKKLCRHGNALSACRQPRISMKTESKPATQKIIKKRLICITLPKSLLATAKAYRRKNGFSSMSELLRATVEHVTAASLKKNAPESKTQISFRLSDALYSTLSRASAQSGQSIARIIRTLLENAPKIGILPPGISAKKKRTQTPKPQAAKTTVSAKKTTTAPTAKTGTKKIAGTKTATVKKVVPAAKPTPQKKKSAVAETAKKSVPAKSATTAKNATTATSVPEKTPATKSATASAKQRTTTAKTPSPRAKSASSTPKAKRR